MRNIIADDDALQEGILPSLREYNIAQFTTVDVPGTEHQVSGRAPSEYVVKWLLVWLWR